jgi:uncharacterized protein (TIGR03086 family)
MSAEVPELHRRAAGRIGHLVHAVRADQWTLPTPCAEWDVRALVGHVVTENLWVPPLFEGLTVADVGSRLDGDPLGADARSAWDGSAAAATAAISADGAMDRVVHLSFGDVPGHEYVTQLVADLVIHGWDLARAIGQDETLDPELVALCASWFSGIAEQARQAGIVGPALPVSETADAQTRLLADFGRDTSSPSPVGTTVPSATP